MHRFENIDFSPVYSAIGEFVTRFERICREIRFIYGCFLQNNGLEKWKLGEILLYNKVFTADPLNSAFLTGAIEASKDFKDATIFAAQAGSIHSTFKKMIELRNKILHADWITGEDVVIISDTSDMPSAHGVKKSFGRDGSSHQSIDNNEIISGVETLKKLGKAIKQFKSDYLKADYENDPNKYKQVSGGED
jgi:hypothetical protein